MTDHVIVLSRSVLRVGVPAVAAAALVVLVLSPRAVSGRQEARSVAGPQLAGSLDPSFASGGEVIHGLGSGEYPTINAIALQPDGKIVVAVPSSPGDHGLLLARYLPDGSPDPSFGDGGYAEAHTGDWAFASAVAVQPDGKIVVAGASDQGNDDAVSSVFTLARYNPDGSLDPSFGTAGITTTDIPASGYRSAGADALAVLAGGDILVGGSSRWGDPTGPGSTFVLARYTPDGLLDPTFGVDGIVQTSFYGDDALGGIAVQPDGKIVATGTGALAGHGQDVETIALARYEPDGSLDHTFGTGGKVTTRPKLHYDGGPSTFQGVNIVVAGFTRPNSGANDVPLLARYDASGHLDPSFGKDGFAEIRRVRGNAAVQGRPTAVLAQADGKLLIAAAASIVRLRPNGRLDESFGKGGIVSLTDRVATSALALQVDGKILVGGSSGNTLQGAGHTWVLARLTAGNNCVVPGLSGETVSKASARLKHAYCRRGHVSSRPSSTIKRGRVISSMPRRGVRRPGGARVDLTVSRGRPVRHS